jgi:CrcB protein
MTRLLAVLLGGATGALLRYGTGLLVSHCAGASFPWATWAVNLIGCVLIGAAVPLLGALQMGEEVRLFLVVGLLGSFTTFSTYSLDTLALLGDGQGGAAFANAAGSLILGLACVWLGRAMADWVLTG